MNELLKAIADNPALFDALKSLLKKHFSLDDIGTTYDNETLGQMVRARVDGLKKLESAFKEIAGHATLKEKEELKNPGR